MGIRLGNLNTPVDLTSLQQQIADAAQMAAKAEATGQNARQMVLTRDPKLATLEAGQTTLTTDQQQLKALADTLGAAIPASETRHAQMDARDAAIEAAAAALTTRVAALEARRAIRQVKTITTTAAIALGASLDITCPWDTPFPDANYVAVVDLDATGLMLSSIGPAWKTQTATACTFTLKAGVAITAGVKLRYTGLWTGS